MSILFWPPPLSQYMFQGWKRSHGWLGSKFHSVQWDWLQGNCAEDFSPNEPITSFLHVEYHHFTHYMGDLEATWHLELSPQFYSAFKLLPVICHAFKLMSPTIFSPQLLLNTDCGTWMSCWRRQHISSNTQHLFLAGTRSSWQQLCFLSLHVNDTCWCLLELSFTWRRGKGNVTFNWKHWLSRSKKGQPR